MIENKTKFTVCGHDELKKKGWKIANSPGFNSIDYRHPEFSGIITWLMIEDYQGQTLTVSGNGTLSLGNRWFFVEENSYLWPVEIFLGTAKYHFKKNALCLMGVHVKGMTPIDGWVICKYCGDNIGKVK